MKKTSTPLYNFFLLISMVIVDKIKAQQDVGIGTLSPDHKLYVPSNTSALFKLDNRIPLNTGIKSEIYFKTGKLQVEELKKQINQQENTSVNSHP